MSEHYKYTEEIHNMEAPSEVVPLLLKMVQFKSVLDVGCGTGTWLKVFHENGIDDYLGLDHENLNRNLLNIPETNFKAVDLSKPFDLGRKFDLVISLEVAEHLDEKYSETFVDNLIKHGETILFSAAIPGQGGQGHVNEQWPSYWQEKFKKRSYFFDNRIRNNIWNNAKVEWWYKQNIFLVTKVRSDDDQMISVVHPELFDRTKADQKLFEKSLLDGVHGLRMGWKIFLNSIIHKIKSIF